MIADYKERWVRLAVSPDETRTSIARVWIEGGRRFATDGHRLHVALDTESTRRAEPPAADDCVPPPIEQVIPQDGAMYNVNAQSLARALEEAYKLDLGDKAMRAVGLRRILRHYNRPETAALEVVLTPQAYAAHGAAIKMRVRWASDGGIDLGGTVVDDVFYCNGRYLVEALKYAPRGESTVTLRWPDFTRKHAAFGPLKVTHTDGRVAVIMPVAIDRRKP